MSDKKKTLKLPKKRNWLAVRAFQKTGGGKHKDKSKYTRKRKHKSKQNE